MFCLKPLANRTIDCFDDRLPFRRQIAVNLEGKGYTQVNRMCRSRRCWLPEVNKQNMDGQGLYLSIFISYREFLGDESSKQVASLLNDKDSECVKCF